MEKGRRCQLSTPTPGCCLLLDQTELHVRTEESPGKLKKRKTRAIDRLHNEHSLSTANSLRLCAWFWRDNHNSRFEQATKMSKSTFSRSLAVPSLSRHLCPGVCSKVATRLFSGQELSALRRDASFRRQIEEGLVMEVDPSTTATTGGARGRGFGPKGDPVAGGLKDRDPRDWSEVSWKSVCLARQEKERRACHAKEGTKDAPSNVDSENSQAKVSGTGTSARGAGREGAEEAKAGGRGRSLQETESSSMRQHARKREDEFLAGGAQNFYKPVRVCGSCFRVSGLMIVSFCWAEF